MPTLRAADPHPTPPPPNSNSAHQTTSYWRRLLASPRFPLIATALAILLTSSSLGVGLLMDDYWLKLTITAGEYVGEPFPNPLDVYRFFDADPARTQRWMDIGFLPWWTYPGIKAEFWRPVTLVTHWLDFSLWPDWPVLMHLHSLLWYGLLVFLLSRLYRQLIQPAWLAGLAALLYAIDDAHGQPVGWIANRNILVCATFGVGALLAHDHWRRAGWTPGSLAGPALLALSLLAKEAGIGTCAYLGAYALCLERGPTWRRLVTLWPYVAVVVLWRVVWASQGYGVASAGGYIDPLHEPARFVPAVLERIPLLVLAQWALPPAETFLLLESQHARKLWVVALVCMHLLMIAFAPLLHRDRVARFWALGMSFALIPVCTTYAADRLLFFIGIGAMGLLAVFLHSVLGRPDPPVYVNWRRWLAVPLAVLFIPIHLVIAPIALTVRAALPAGPEIAERFAVTVPLGEQINEQDLILVNPPSAVHVMFMAARQTAHDQPLPEHIRVLCSGPQTVRVHRPDTHTLIITPQRGYFAWPFDQLFRPLERPFAEGQRIELPGMTVEILALTADRRPAQAAFYFDVPLEHPSLQWLCWLPADFTSFTPPPVGATIEIDPFDAIRSLPAGTGGSE